MNNRDYISSIITQFSGQNNVIPIPVIYLKITEDYPSAVLLNQMVYWSDRTSRKDGYFYKSYNDWFQELHLTEYQVRRATNKLKTFGFVDTALKKANGAPTLHYKVDTKEISEWILKKLKNGNLTNLRMDTEETQESLTEITTETTTETTNNNSATDVTREQFEEWWNLYGKKKGKDSCYPKFKKRVKEDSFEKVMEGTKLYLKTIKDKQFQKYPLTFLNQKTYKDDFSDELEPETDNPYANLF
jgi:hypothetical protein